MDRTADIVVIGGGVMGASIALHLALKEAGRVVVVEKGTLGSGPTGRSSALLRRHHSLELYARMATRALEVYRHFEELTGAPADVAWCGMLTLVGPEDVEAMRTTCAMLRRVGADAEALDVDGLRRLVPHMSLEGLAGAGYDPTTGYADPAAVTNGYAKRARELGVAIHQMTTVTGLLTRGDAVTGVVTDQGNIEAPRVVNAAGVWAPRIAAMAGVHLPITASRVQVTSFRAPADFPHPRLVTGDNVLGCYIRPEGQDLMLVGTRSKPGALAAVDPDASDTRVDEERVLLATEALCTRYPAMANGEATGGYTSMYDMTPDGHFIIEPTPGRPGLFTAAGFSGHGFKHSPVVGRAMADLVVDGTTAEIDLAPFSSARFTDGRPSLRGTYKGFAF